jgi:hypothetical protein
MSRSLTWYQEQGVPIEEFKEFFDEIKQSFLQNLIIFDLNIGNLLFQKSSTSSAQLVAIDGLGDVVAFDWLDYFPFLVRRKINSRWKRFMARIDLTADVRQQRAQMAAADLSQSNRS